MDANKMTLLPQNLLLGRTSKLIPCHAVEVHCLADIIDRYKNRDGRIALES